MVRVCLENVSICFRRKHLFPALNYTFSPDQIYAITGPNGSGKSSLMRLIAGQLRPSQGVIRFLSGEKEIDPEDWYKYITWSGPYIDLPGELSLKELLSFHFQFRSLPEGLTLNDIVEVLGFEQEWNKPVKLFSSGMLHRLKTGLALFTKSDVILLDEPTSNLDEQNKLLIIGLIKEKAKGKILILASNELMEIALAREEISLKK